MTDAIDERLARLEKYVQLLEGLRNKDIKDPYTRGALERYLHLAAEASLDIGEPKRTRTGGSSVH